MYLSHTDGQDNYMYSYVRQAAGPVLSTRYSEQARSGTSLKGPDGLWGTPSLQLTINTLTPNDPYSGRTAPLTSKRCILYIYSTNTGTEYFKHGIYSPFIFSSKCRLFHNSNVFGSCFVHVLYTGCAKI